MTSAIPIMESAKDKGPAPAIEDPPSNLHDRKSVEESSAASSSSAARLPARNASSKYDFVKVKVWLGDNADHYYVLSRFLLSRMLTVTKIPNHVAIKIALELKKLLIDNSLLDVSQSDLEANLFKLMERRGYGQEYISRYKMMTRFHHQRVPLVILVCGTACTGKSTTATQLAQRLNLPNVLQTDMVYELLRTSTDAPLVSTPVWARDFSSSEELITEFCRECRIVRKGLAGDMKKAMKDGKPIIIEGIHLDPSIYLMDKENRELTNVQPERKKSTNVQLKDVIPKISKNDETSVSQSSLPVVERFQSMNLSSTEIDAGSRRSCHMVESESTSVVQGAAVPTCSDPHENSPEYQGEKCKDADPKVHNRKQEKTAAEPIIVPIVLKMAEFDHKALLEEWIFTRFGDKCLEQDQQKLIRNLKTIQDYLCSFEFQGLTVVNISATTFPQTLDWLHGYLLQCIERGVSSHASSATL